MNTTPSAIYWSHISLLLLLTRHKPLYASEARKMSFLAHRCPKDVLLDI